VVTDRHERDVSAQRAARSLFGADIDLVVGPGADDHGRRDRVVLEGAVPPVDERGARKRRRVHRVAADDVMAFPGEGLRRLAVLTGVVPHQQHSHRRNPLVRVAILGSIVHAPRGPD